jgi:hypothetical protein
MDRSNIWDLQAPANEGSLLARAIYTTHWAWVPQSGAGRLQAAKWHIGNPVKESKQFMHLFLVRNKIDDVHRYSIMQGVAGQAGFQARLTFARQRQTGCIFFVSPEGRELEGTDVLVSGSPPQQPEPDDRSCSPHRDPMLDNNAGLDHR